VRRVERTTLFKRRCFLALAYEHNFVGCCFCWIVRHRPVNALHNKKALQQPSLPVIKDRIDQGHGGDGGGICPHDAWSQRDGQNEGLRAQYFPLMGIEAAFRANQQGGGMFFWQAGKRFDGR